MYKDFLFGCVLNTVGLVPQIVDKKTVRHSTWRTAVMGMRTLKDIALSKLFIYGYCYENVAFCERIGVN